MSIARPIASLLLVMAASAAAIEVDGHTVPDTIQLSGHPLLLNGAALRRFAIFKVEVAALYITEKATSLEAVNAAAGPKSWLLMLHDVSNADLNRKFMSEHRAVGQHGRAGGPRTGDRRAGCNVSRLRRPQGRRHQRLDWLPGQGLMATRNGTALGSLAIPSERLYGVVLRIFLGPKADEAARDRLLGLKAAKQ